MNKLLKALTPFICLGIGVAVIALLAVMSVSLMVITTAVLAGGGL